VGPGFQEKLGERNKNKEEGVLPASCPNDDVNTNDMAPSGSSNLKKKGGGCTPIKLNNSHNYCERMEIAIR